MNTTTKYAPTSDEEIIAIAKQGGTVNIDRWQKISDEQKVLLAATREQAFHYLKFNVVDRLEKMGKYDNSGIVTREHIRSWYFEIRELDDRMKAINDYSLFENFLLNRLESRQKEINFDIHILGKQLADDWHATPGIRSGFAVLAIIYAIIALLMPASIDTMNIIAGTVCLSFMIYCIQRDLLIRIRLSEMRLKLEIEKSEQRSFIQSSERYRPPKETYSKTFYENEIESGTRFSFFGD